MVVRPRGYKTDYTHIGTLERHDGGKFSTDVLDMTPEFREALLRLITPSEAATKAMARAGMT